MKNKRRLYIKLLLLVIFLLLSFFAYRYLSFLRARVDCDHPESWIYVQNHCPQKEFSIYYIMPIKDENMINKNCLEVSGTIANTYHLPISNIKIEVDFITSPTDGTVFYKEEFSLFQQEGEYVGANSERSFTQCLSSQSQKAVETANNWRWTVIPVSAKVSGQ